MNDIPRNSIFIQDQRLSRLVLRPEDHGDKLKHLRAQHGGEAWESRAEFEKLTNELRRQPRWHTVSHRSELFSQFQSRERVLLAVTAYAGIGKSIVLQQIDGLLSFACEGTDVVRAEFSDLPVDWEQYMHKPWKSDKPFLVRILSDEFSKLRRLGHQLPTIDPDDLRQWAEAKIRTGKFVLAVDGLDEYNAPDAADKAKQLRHLLLEVFPKLHCVVAGRPHAITQELWRSLFSESPESAKNSPRSDWEFMRVEMFDREQLERFLGKEMTDQLKMLEAEIEFSARNLEALRTLDNATISAIRSTADLYWHSIVESLPEDNREGIGKRLLHTNLKVDEILQMLSAIGITMALWHEDPRFPVDPHGGSLEFGVNTPISGTEANSKSNAKYYSDPGVMEVGGSDATPINEFKRRLFARLLGIYPEWRDIEPGTKRKLVELRFEELIQLNAQYVEFGFFREQDANRIRWRNATLRDFFAALWLSTCANEVERDAFHARIDVARDARDSSVARTWKMICGMPNDIARLCEGANESAQSLQWLRIIAPLYKSPEEESRFHGRPTELMFRAWPNLLSRAGFLQPRSWNEEDLLRATIAAQRSQHRISSTLQSLDSDKREHFAWSLLGSFLGQFQAIQERDRDAYRTIHMDLDRCWCDINTYSGMTVRVGDSWMHNEREVILTYEFSLCAMQVTNRLYDLFDPAHQSRYPIGYSSREHYRTRDPLDPVGYVTWYDAIMFCIWCHGYLPSEWEWEYAFRRAEKEHAQGSIEKQFGRKREISLRETKLHTREWCRNLADHSAPAPFGQKRVLRGGFSVVEHPVEWWGSTFSRSTTSHQFDPNPAFGLRVLRFYDSNF